MSPHQQNFYYPRATSPQLVGRIPTPPPRADRRASWYRSESPPLVTQVLTPGHQSRRPTTPVIQETVREVRYRPRETVGSRLSNLFRPQRRTVEIIQTPVHSRRQTATRQAPSPPPANRRRRSYPPVTPTAQPTPPPVYNRSHGLSARMPPEYVPLPQPQPLVQPGSPTPPRSRSQEEEQAARSRSPRHGQYRVRETAGHWDTVEQIERHPQVTTEHPVRSNPESREARLIRKNEEYRRENQRFASELETYRNQVLELRDRLTAAETRARSASSEAERAVIAVEELRTQLVTNDQRLEDERRHNRHLSQENNELNNELQQLGAYRDTVTTPRETVIHNDRPRNRGQPVPQAKDNATNMAALRQAQRDAAANRGGRGRGNGLGYQ